MKTDWLMRKGRGTLLLFFCGWGMDHRPFLPLSCKNYDLMICYDYGEVHLQPDVVELAQNYAHVILVGWSMGVLYGQLNFREHRDLLDAAIAINGTLRPVDDNYGIPENVFKATLNQLNEESLRKFYKRMCRDNATVKQFLDSRPQRDVANQRRELKKIFTSGFSLTEEESIYGQAVISIRDYIFPTANQLAYWQKTKKMKISSSHFPFYTFQSWDDLIEQIHP